jgi:hypothetical protein
MKNIFNLIDYEITHNSQWHCREITHIEVGPEMFEHICASDDHNHVFQLQSSKSLHGYPLMVLNPSKIAIGDLRIMSENGKELVRISMADLEGKNE